MSKYTCMHYSTLEDSERKTKQPFNKSMTTYADSCANPRHQTVKWVFLLHLYELKIRTGNANARHIWVAFVVITFNDYTTIHRCVCVCVSFYAFLICRWLKRKSPVAHCTYSWVYIRVACKKKIRMRAPHTRNAISMLQLFSTKAMPPRFGWNRTRAL